MAASLNTFAVVLLAFPFYLAQKKRLVSYVNLAKPNVQGSTSTSASSVASTQTSNAPSTSTQAPSSGGTSSAASTASTVATLSPLFTDAVKLFV